MRTAYMLLIGLFLAQTAIAQVRVQDIARLQGQRKNRLMGYGLVVGLKGTGDGDKNPVTMRALLAMHKKFGQNAAEIDLRGNANVAMVTVTVNLPEYGANEGQALDVEVSAIGTAKSIDGGELLPTPLQADRVDPNDESTQRIIAIAGGAPIEVSRKDRETRGVIRGGAVLNEDLYYIFVADGAITLVLNDEHAGYQWAQMMARAINHEMTSPARDGRSAAEGRIVVDEEPAVVLNPRFIRVMIPDHELANPSGYISRVLQTPLFLLPEQAATVTINRAKQLVSWTGAATVSATTLNIPGVGLIAIGEPEESDPAAADGGKPRKPREVGPIPLSHVVKTLNKIKLTSEQLVDAVEQLHRSGSLHAKLEYLSQ